MGRLAKGLAIAVLTIAGLLATAVALAYALSARALNVRYPAAARAVRVPVDAPSIERGRHLFHAVASCALCHGDDGSK